MCTATWNLSYRSVDFFFNRWQLGRMIAVIDCTRANESISYIYIFIVTIRCTVQVHPIWNQHLQALFCLFLDETTWQVELDMGEFPNVSGWQIQVVLGSPCFMVKSCQNEIRCFFMAKTLQWWWSLHIGSASCSYADTVPGSALHIQPYLHAACNGYHLFNGLDPPPSPGILFESPFVYTKLPFFLGVSR